jgi:hypothetical protein
MSAVNPELANAHPAIDPQRTSRLTELLQAQPKTRLSSDLLWRLFAEAFPTRPQGPEERALLSTLLHTLSEHGVIRLPSVRNRRLWDDSARIPLPRQVTVVQAIRPSTDKHWQCFPWHPRLSFIADLPHLPDEQLAFLNRVHRGLVAGSFVQAAPLKFRSLELTGHEKRLAQIAKSQLFAPGRLDLQMLGCSEDPLPLVWEEVGPRSAIILFENASAFSVGRSILSQIQDPPYGLIGYGGGSRIARSLPYLRTISREVREIDYVGDLDRDGLRIALAAQHIAQETGMPVPRPAPGLHRLMLDAARQFEHPRGWPHRKKRASGTSSDAELLAFLPADVRSAVAPILAADRRIPEEVVGPQALSVLWRRPTVP